MGLQTWGDFPRAVEDLRERGYTKDGPWLDVRGFPNFDFAPGGGGVGAASSSASTGFGNHESAEFSGSPAASQSSGASYDGCAFDSSSLSSSLMDGNVRAMLKKVTVNEDALNQTIQSLGGGEKGLKELMGYIMTWVREHSDENSDCVSFSQHLENLRTSPLPLNPPSLFFGYATDPTPLGDAPHDTRLHCLEAVQSCDATPELNPFYQLCSKSRRLTVEDHSSDSYRTRTPLSEDHSSDPYRRHSAFPDVRVSVPASEFQHPKHEMGNNPIAGFCIPNQKLSAGRIGIHGELEAQQAPVGFPPFASGHDDLTRSFAAKTRAARRNRVARQRSQSLQQRQQGLPRAASAGCGLWSSSSALDLRSSVGMSQPQPQPPPPRPQHPVAAGGCSSGWKGSSEDMLTFLLQKELRPSDVGNLGRIILPKKEAEMHLPILALREGMLLRMEDFDSGHCWNIRYRFWPNNKSRMYLLENTGEFVKSHRLQEGDLLILYRNQQGNYVLRGKKVHSENRGGAQGLRQKNAHSLARGFPEASKTEDVLKEKDFGVGLLLEDRSYQKAHKERNFGLDLEAGSSQQKVVQERDFGLQLEDGSKVAKERDLGLELEDWSCKNVIKDRDFGVGLLLEDLSCLKAVKEEPTVLVGDDDPFFKEDVMHNIGSSFGTGLLQPLERFPSLNLDFVLDEIMVSISKDSNENEGSKQAVVLKTEHAV